MTKSISQFSFGSDVKLWLGVVENRTDPLNLGRAQVRIHGHHIDDDTLIPTADLPWAFPVMPLDHGGVSGVGTNVTIMIGTMVIGFWADYPDCQIPMMLGSLNQVELFSGGVNGAGGTLNQTGNQINDQTTAGGPGTIRPTGDGPKWLQIARGELQKGVKEWPGASHNPEVLKYGKDLGFTTDDSQHPWCASFVRWCLKEGGASVQGVTGMAKSPLTASSMETLTEPVYGCVAVYHRSASSKNSPSGHCGFWVGREGGRDKLLGGNQGSAVTITSMNLNTLAGYRWPSGQPKPASTTATNVKDDNKVNDGSEDGSDD